MIEESDATVDGGLRTDMHMLLAPLPGHSLVSLGEGREDLRFCVLLAHTIRWCDMRMSV